MNRTRSIRPPILIALMLSAALSGSAPVFAQTPAERAAALYQEGNAAVDQKKWSEAEAAYLKAWELARSFDVAANLGLVEMRLDKPRAAAEYLAFSLRNAPPSAKPAQRERTQQLLDEAKQKIGTVRLRVNVAGAAISLDGRSIRSEDVEHDLFVDPGTHAVDARSTGYLDARSTFDAKPGGLSTVVLTLLAVPPKRKSLAPAFALGGVGAAAAIVGGVFVGVAEAKRSDAQALSATIAEQGRNCRSSSPDCETLHAKTASGDAFGNAGIGLFVVAGAAATAAVIYGIWPTTQVRATPLASAGVGGVVVSGSF